MPNEKSDKEPSFNITLSEFLLSHLREDFSIPISHRLGEIVESISRDKLLCHVQWKDHDGVLLHSPVLWRYKYWVESVDKWVDNKKKSEQERVRHFIFLANVKIVTKLCMTYMLMDEHRANELALNVVRYNKPKFYEMLKLLGAEVKLITKEDEL